MSFGPPPSMPSGPATAAEPPRTGAAPAAVAVQGGRAPRKLLIGLLEVVLVGALGAGGRLLWGRDGKGSDASGKAQAPVPQGPLDVREAVEKKPASTSGEMAFRFSVDDMKPGEHVEMPGMWATDRILAKGLNKTAEDQVFIRSKDQSEVPTWNWSIGFDLATGKTTKKFDSGRGALLYPVRMSGDRLLALSVSEDDIAPNALVALDASTGAQVPYLYFGLPAEARLMTMTEHHDVVVQNGRLFFGVKSAEVPAEANTKQWSYLVLGIGSSAPRTS